MSDAQREAIATLRERFAEVSARLAEAERLLRAVYPEGRAPGATVEHCEHGKSWFESRDAFLGIADSATVEPLLNALADAGLEGDEDLDAAIEADNQRMLRAAHSAPAACPHPSVTVIDFEGGRVCTCCGVAVRRVGHHDRADTFVTADSASRSLCQCDTPDPTPFNRSWCHHCGYEIATPTVSETPR